VKKISFYGLAADRQEYCFTTDYLYFYIYILIISYQLSTHSEFRNLTDSVSSLSKSPILRYDRSPAAVTSSTLSPHRRCGAPVIRQQLLLSLIHVRSLCPRLNVHIPSRRDTDLTRESRSCPAVVTQLIGAVDERLGPRVWVVDVSVIQVQAYLSSYSHI